MEMIKLISCIQVLWTSLEDNLLIWRNIMARLAQIHLLNASMCLIILGGGRPALLVSSGLTTKSNADTRRFVKSSSISGSQRTTYYGFGSDLDQDDRKDDKSSDVEAIQAKHSLWESVLPERWLLSRLGNLDGDKIPY